MNTTLHAIIHYGYSWGADQIDEAHVKVAEYSNKNAELTERLVGLQKLADQASGPFWTAGYNKAWGEARVDLERKDAEIASLRSDLAGLRNEEAAHLAALQAEEDRHDKIVSALRAELDLEKGLRSTLLANWQADTERKETAGRQDAEEKARLTESHARMKQLWENTEADLAVAKSNSAEEIARLKEALTLALDFIKGIGVTPKPKWWGSARAALACRPQEKEIANFKKQEYGAVVATIVETVYSVVEVKACKDGKYDLIIHTRRCEESDRWDDLTAGLTAEQFALLGTVAQHMRDNACRLQEKPHGT